ncbi:MAG TPA: homocysteine S-methyltransferase family protein [Candidatus Limnocylindrales bacterium]|nr:homocysteine S-methyltransferase family protein [Candidatus Limnocylindrales bacterium]
MTTWAELLASNRPIVADGAMGTMLMSNGLEFGDPPELWNLEHPEIIRRVQRGYVDAGSQVLLTNTFGGNRLRLELHGREDRVDQLNRTAAVLARVEANAADHPVLVAGDIGPSGQIMAAIGGSLSPEIAREVFAEQARGLAAAGVDVMWVETMSDVSEAVAAIQGAKDAAPDVPVIATMSFDTRGHTMMGVTPERAAEALLEAGAAAVGGNCGNGPEEIIPVIEKMRAAFPDAVLVAKGNVGQPTLVGMSVAYETTPEMMAGFARRFADAGANVIGACCGSTPPHLAAMAEALAKA